MGPGLRRGDPVAEASFGILKIPLDYSVNQPRTSGPQSDLAMAPHPEVSCSPDAAGLGERDDAGGDDFGVDRIHLRLAAHADVADDPRHLQEPRLQLREDQRV